MEGRTGLCQAMFEEANYGIGVHDAETGRLETANDVYVELLGRDRDAVEGASLDDLVDAVPFLDDEPVETSVDRAVAGVPQRRYCIPTASTAGGGQLELSLECIDVDGEALVVARLRDLGSIGGALERLAVEMTGLGVWEWQLGTDEVRWNEQFEQLAGLEAGEFGGTYADFAERVPDADLEQLEAKIEVSLEEDALLTDEYRIRREDGTYVWLQARGQPVTTEDGRRYVGTVTDITHRKRQEHEVAELSTHLDIALGGASPAVWEWDMETDELVVNDRVEELIGMESGEFEETFDRFIERTHPEDVPKVQEAIQTAIDNDELYETEFRLAHEDGGWIWVAARGRLDDERADRLIGVISDITDQKTYERQLAESNEELERLTEQLEFFTSILRHDVLNGMTVIKMRAELLADQLEGEQAQYAETILEWANTTTDVTERVREVIETLTEPDEGRQFQPIGLTGLLEKQVQDLQAAYPGASFSSVVEPDVTVLADELLGDALGNVLSNSIEHNDADRLRVETTLETDGDVARLTIEDDGTGIADDRKEAVFRRGETSHAKESGSGFGLFYVDVMIDSYGGDIWVEDSEAGGARFVIELPLARAGGEA